MSEAGTRYLDLLVWRGFGAPLLVMGILTAVAGCGGGGGGGGSALATPTVTSVSVSCSPTSISTNQTSACTSTVSGTGSFSPAVTWSVSPTSIGTVSSSGVFTPTGAGTATITATSTQDSTKSGDSTLTVTAAVTITSVSVSCSPATIQTNQTSACAATVNGMGSLSSGVTWSASPSGIGTISSTGVFTPETAGTAMITATSTQDTTKSGSTSVAVTSTAGFVQGDWTWIGGSSGYNGLGVYGTQGVPSASNSPGARVGSLTWTDSNGKLWLFGGGDSEGAFNDLWSYDTSSGAWAWVGGSKAYDAPGVYGTQGVPATSNIPGARVNAVSWIDAENRLWLFGGGGVDAIGVSGELNDLWSFDTSTGAWTWVSGSNEVGQYGSYGGPGTVPAPIVPGAREYAVSWTDRSGTFWLFGGFGIDSKNNGGDLNDLWTYAPSTGIWTWVSGSETVDVYGNYGTQGVPAASNVPSARDSAVSWIDGQGYLWLFGGTDDAFDGNPEIQGWLNDLWRYDPSTGMWTWMSGSNGLFAPGVYGTQGIPAASDVPGARVHAVSWTDASGNLWLFGGIGGIDTVLQDYWLNDLWAYSPSAGVWTWMNGSSTGNAPGAYGTQGVPATSNVPGARENAVGWAGPNGQLWLFAGDGLDSNLDQVKLNDLWVYDPPASTQ